mgnify:CR=1 FL=1
MNQDAKDEQARRLHERVAELEREKESMLKDRVALAVRVEELERDATAERDSRTMFVARLEMLNGAMTAGDVLGLLNDCDYLANVAIDAARSKEGGVV